MCKLGLSRWVAIMEVSSNVQMPMSENPVSSNTKENNETMIADDEEGWMEVRNKKSEGRPSNGKANHSENGGYYERPKRHARGFRSHPDGDKTDNKYREDISNNNAESPDSPDGQQNSDGDSDEKTFENDKNKVEFVAAPIPKKNAWGASEAGSADKAVSNAIEKKPDKPIIPKKEDVPVVKSEPIPKLDKKPSEDWSEIVKESDNMLVDDTNGKEFLIAFIVIHQTLT